MDRRDIGAEEDLKPGRVVLFPSVGGHDDERSDHRDCGCAGDDHCPELLPGSETSPADVALV